MKNTMHFIFAPLVIILAACSVIGRKNSEGVVGNAQVDIARPVWAGDFGKDEFGVWADLQIAGCAQRFRYISSGRFTMGSPIGERGRGEDENMHRVFLFSGYWMAETECCQGLWEAVMGNNPMAYNERNAGRDKPVASVSYYDCEKFLKKLSSLRVGLQTRLPSEAEWEYACRAGSSGPFSGDIDKVGWTGGGGADMRLFFNVKGKLSNAYGLYDMHGNVSEWCRDWYGDYSSAEAVDPRGPETGAKKVFRGGSYGSHSSWSRSAARWSVSPDVKNPKIGFRFIVSE